MWTLLVVCSVVASHGVRGGEEKMAAPPETPDAGGVNAAAAVTGGPSSCLYNCGRHMGHCSCYSDCNYYGNCCPDYNYYCSSPTTLSPDTTPVTSISEEQSSCRHSCDEHMASCSCQSSCLYYGNCCYDYYDYCSSTTEPVTPGISPTTSVTSVESATTEQPSCRHNCGYNTGSCSCSSSCRYYGNCCSDYYDYCSSTTEPDTESTGPEPSCRHNCDRHFGSCSCSSSCLYHGSCCRDYNDYCSPTTAEPVTPGISPTTSVPYPTTPEPSCRYNCGYNIGSCSCSSDCRYYGNCCRDYYDYCSSTTEPDPEPTTPVPSCRHNCGRHMGSCSCYSDCFSDGSCCRDYYDYCPSPTTSGPESTATEQPSCRHNCGGHMGSCSCSSSCRYYGNCCRDYYDYCSSTTEPVTPEPSCRYNCGYNMGSCSCSSSCRYYGSCCRDYNYYCNSTTVTPTPEPSCRHNCGGHMGSCSCYSSCLYYGNCCYDYYDYCSSTTTSGPETTAPYPTGPEPSCRYNCGYNMGSCSCSSSCRYYGSCCRDYNYYCNSTTVTPTPEPSCRYNCGYNMGSCSCSSSCRYYGNCCHDYNYYCEYNYTTPTTPEPSCRYNCGDNMGSCSCSSSCRYYGNCCHDYNYYCNSTTVTPTPGPSCRHNCGYNMGSCSCSSDCRYYGNCCYDYYDYCDYITGTPTPEKPCGGTLYGSGNFSSPNHPGYYQDNTYCVWYLRTNNNQTINLHFTFLELENCCSCDYISVHNGPSVNSPYLGTVCNDSSQISFHSSSKYMTVRFRTDHSGVGRGFHAEFMSSLPASSGRVECYSDNMQIVIAKSYLNSLGYDGNSLYLNDPHCRPQIYSYEVVFNFPINNCGNVQKFENGSMVYTNNLRAYANSYGEITRQSSLKLFVGCRMAQDSVSHIMYLVHRRDNSSIIGTGRFNTKMDFYTTSSFYDKVHHDPYEVTLNQNLYVQVDLTRYANNLVLFLDTCVTSPSPYDFNTRPYYLVRNGCSVDSTYQPIISGSRSYARFTFKAFQFLRATESVYIQCKVLICQASDYNSLCRRGCRKRRARSLGLKHESQTLVLGPIHLKDIEKMEKETQTEA